MRLLGVGLPLTIVAGTLAGLALFPQLDVWTAAALATVLAPTDAALGLPVVSNRRLPSRICQGLNVESGQRPARPRLSSAGWPAGATVLSALVIDPDDAAEAQVGGCGVDRLGHACGRTVAPAVVRRAQV